MRKLLMVTVLVGAAAAASGARAAPHAGPIPLASGAPAAQSVQYYYYPTQYDEEWRHREWRRHEEIERWRRHQEWRRERYEERWHGRYGW